MSRPRPPPAWASTATPYGASCSNIIWRRAMETSRNNSEFRIQNAETGMHHEQQRFAGADKGICLASHQVVEFAASRPFQRCPRAANPEVGYVGRIELARSLPRVLEAAFHHDHGNLPA